jgi:hypothetical protein
VQPAGGQHSGRDELADSRLIDEEHEAGIAGRPVNERDNIVE